MRFYALVIWRTRGVVPALLRLVYLGDGQMVSYEPDEHDLLATERLVEAIWRAIELARQTGEFLPSPGWACTLVQLPGALPHLRQRAAADAGPHGCCSRPVPLGPQRRRGPVRHADRAVDRGQVRLDRALGDAEAARDLLVRQPLPHQLEHLSLASGEVSPAERPRAAGREQLPGHPRVER